MRYHMEQADRCQRALHDRLDCRHDDLVFDTKPIRLAEIPAVSSPVCFFDRIPPPRDQVFTLHHAFAVAPRLH